MNRITGESHSTKPNTKECLLRQVNFVSEKKSPSFEGTDLASSKSDIDIDNLLHGYQLCATTERKSTNSLAIITRSVTYLYDFLSSNDLSTDVTQIGFMGMRVFLNFFLSGHLSIFLMIPIIAAAAAISPGGGKGRRICH